MVLNNGRHANEGLRRRILPAALSACILTGTVLFVVSPSSALIDLPIFGPKRYDRLKGKPAVYTDTFERCNPATQAILKVTNGDSKKTRIKSARIYINGIKVAMEKDFKQKVPSFEKTITIQEQNELKVILKSGRHGYLDKLAKYQEKKANLEQELIRLQDLKKELFSVTSVISVAKLEALLRDFRDVKKTFYDRESSLESLSRDLDDDDEAESGDAEDSDDEDELDAGWIGIERAKLEKYHKEVKDSVKEAEKARESLDKTPKNKRDRDHDKKDKALQELAKHLKELDHAIEKAIKKLDSIEEKIEKLKKKGPSFLIIEIIGKGCDDTPPVVSNPEPVDGSLLNTATPTISAVYADNDGGSGIERTTARITVDGRDVTSDASVTDSGISYLPRSNLAEGGHTVTVTVADRAKNAASLTWSFTTDTIAPVVTITSHQNDQYLNTPTITLSGSVDDATATVTVNGQAAQVTGSSFSYSGLNLTEGANTITVSATDPAGNIGTASITINLDTQAPVIAIAAPVSNSFVNTSQITVSGSINEPATTIVKGDRLLYCTTSEYTQKVACPLLLAEGSNTITATAVDRAGNTGTAIVSVTLDTIAPTVTITSHQNGQYLNTPTITLSGTANEPIIEAKVNGAAAQIVESDATWSLSGLSLVEGATTITVTVKDRAGNPGSTSITLNLDTIAPLVQVTSHQTGQFVNTPKAAITGTVNETVTSLTVNGSAAAVNQNSTWSLAELALAEGENILTINATDRAGNIGTAPLTLIRDSLPPVIQVASPVHNSFVNTTTVTVSGTVIEVNPVGFWINDTERELVNGGFSIPGFSLVQGINVIRVKARDKAGNESTASVFVTLDTTPPAVTITSPLNGSITNSATATITGTVNEPATSTINGDRQLFCSSSELTQKVACPLLLNEGDNTITVEATDRAGNSGTASVQLFLDTQAPVVTVSAPGQAAAGANLTISTSASDNRGLSLSELKVNGATVWSFTLNSELSTQNSILYSASPDLAQNTALTVQASVMDIAGNIGTATTQIQIVGAPTGAGYLQGEVYDDSKGLRLEGAQVSLAANGDPSSVPPYQGGIWGVTQADGGYFTDAAAGDYLVTLAKSGFTTVERIVIVRPEKNTLSIDARLTPISTQQNIIDADGGVAKSGSGTLNSELGTLNLDIPANALAEQTDIRITPISNQGLAGLLPVGWSPIAVVDIRSFATEGTEITEGTAFGSQGASLKVPLSSLIALVPSTQVTLTRYDRTSRQWLVQNPGAVSSDGSSISAAVPSTGQYALVLPDANIAAPVAGEVLTSVSSVISVAEDSITATGRVVPAAAPPSAGLKAVGEVIISPSPLGGEGGGEGALTSGLIMNALVTERFDLFSGEVELPSEYVQDLVMYRYPCMTNAGSMARRAEGTSGSTLNSELGTLNSGKIGTSFPVMPSKEYTITELMLGKVGIEVNLRPEDAVAGAMVGADGGRLVDSDGNVLVVPQNALSQTVPVETKTVAPAMVSGIVGSDFTLLRAVEVNLTNRTLSASAELSIPAPSGLNSALPIVVARAIEVRGAKRLKLVALARLSGSLITSYPFSVPSVNSVANGIASSGTYFFLQAKSQLGFITGTVQDGSGNPYPSALATSSTRSLVDLTGANGKYLMAGTVAGFTATATDIYKNDSGSGTGSITSASQVITVNLAIQVTPPRVIAITPADKATNVDPHAPIVITFSEAVDVTTVTTANIVLKDASNTTLPGVFSINPEKTIVTFYPSALLASETKHTISISRSIRDLQGYLMGTDVTTSFTVKDTTPPPMPPAGSITGSFPDADGYVTITATQGSAEANNTVLIINEMTGEIVAVAPDPNGSFTGRIRAMLGDDIKVVLMDQAGNQTLISYITFKSPDGRYLVTAKGGIVDGEGGSQLVIPEGALLGPAVVKLTRFTEAELAHPLPETTGFLAGVKVDAGGATFEKPVKLSVPAPPESGKIPEGSRPFVTEPKVHKNIDGTEEEVFVIHDSAKVIDGRLTTASLPFPGILAGSYFVFAYPYFTVAIASGITYRDIDGIGGYNPQTDRPIKNAVIRTPAAWNMISYSRVDGSYAAFTEIMGNVPGNPCRDFPITAIHPLTMQRVNLRPSVCEPPYNVLKLNIKLADASTIPKDTTAPSLSLNMQVAPNADQDASHQNARFTAGTVPVGTNIIMPLSVTDQEMGFVTLVVKYKTPDMPSAVEYPVPVAQDEQITRVAEVVRDPEAASDPVPIYKYTYQAKFQNAPAPSGSGYPDIRGSKVNYFRPNMPGTYSIVVEATDASGKRSTKTVQVRAVDIGSSPDAVDGPPQVDEIIPAQGAKEIMVTMPVMVTFSEPVLNATADTIKLIDVAAGQEVLANVYTSIEGGRMRAVLQPRNNLTFGKTYKVVVTTGITDAVSNPSVCPVPTDSEIPLPPLEQCVLPLDREYTAEFATKNPALYDLQGEQFQITTGDIALYTDPNSGRSFAYVAAGDKGWRVVDITDPTRPYVTYSETWTNAVRSWRYRGVAVNQETGVLALTEWIFWNYIGGGNFGYVRFYDIGSSPAAPGRIGQARLAENFSGVPGRVGILGNHAFISTVSIGMQVVDIDASRNFSSFDPGASIVGGFNTVEYECDPSAPQYSRGCGSPLDIVVYQGGRALLTTTLGYLLVLDVSQPTFPQLMKAFRHHPAPGPEGYTNARTVAAAPEYAFTDSAGNNQVVDLAVVGSTYPKGTIHTLDMSDPYNPAVMGVVKDSSGNVADNIFATDISISKAAGLIYVTAGMSVYVIDAKDPYHPIILNVITQAPDADGTMTPLGNSQALAEKDGWVYLANQQKGLRVLDLDPVYLSQYCDDGEFPIGAWKFCSDYYPALGWKTIILEGRDTYWALLDSPVKVKLKSMPANGIEVRPAGSTQVCTSADSCKATFDKGYAKFEIRAPANIGDNFSVDFQIDPASLPEHEQTLLAAFANLQQYSMRTVRLWKRDNSNVTLGEVLKGAAAFVFDDTIDTTRHGAYQQNEAENDKRVYYVQEMLNQVVPRKRTLTNPPGLPPANPANPTAYAYSLMDEGGRYAAETASRLLAFKHNFNLGVNATVGFYAPGGAQPYDSNDNTSSIFRKLMKDYGKRQTGASWLVGGTGADSWLHKVVDKDTLIKGEQRIQPANEQVTIDNADVLINGTNGNTRNDTGLYELYKNVVERFNNRVVRLAESYERNANPQNTITDPANPANNRPGQWVSRTGDVQVKTNNTTPLAVAYNYGGRQTIRQFNDIVSRHGAPSTIAFANSATYRSYRGRVGDVADNLLSSFPHGNIGAGNNKKWTGLYKDNEYVSSPAGHHFYYGHWTGIDCNGLTMHGLRYASIPAPYASDQAMGDQDESIPGVMLGDVCVTDRDVLAGDNPNVIGPGNKVCTRREDIHIDTPAPSPYPLVDTNVRKFFNDPAGRLMHYWPRAAQNVKFIRKGDVIRYGITHISTVYSERPSSCVTQNSQAACTYEIIHAFGGDDNGEYTYPSYENDPNLSGQTVFARKAIRTWQDIARPEGFGRIKLWD